ncbi:MAG: M20/M25/M40 family metallo-hydrolase [Gammaproteobacteria bacterium]
MNAKPLLIASLLSAALASFAPSALAAEPALRDKALGILKDSIAHRTVNGEQMVEYGNYLKGVLVDGGYRPEEVTVEAVAGSAILIARYPGSNPSLKPIVVLGHMDVVEAKPEDWERDPFTAVVENGYVFGRGASDNKFDVSMAVATLAKLRREGWKPGRDVILALSGDEETKMATTAVLAERLKNAELAINIDGGGGLLVKGKAVNYGIQGAEKSYADFRLVVTDAGGHSSRPTPGNPIYRLSRALAKLAEHRFPVMSNDITRENFRGIAAQFPGEMGEAMRRFADDPSDATAVAVLERDLSNVGTLRTTCVATMLSGGHAPNALPQRAEAVVNCRIFPGTPAEEVGKTIASVLADPSISITRMEDGALDSPASPLRDDVMAAVKRAVHARYPGLPVLPEMASGATDSMYFRAAGVPSYGLSGLFAENGESYAHGLNERSPVAAIDYALDHHEVLLRELAK